MVAEVLGQVAPRPRDPDELHDLLLNLVSCRPVSPWQQWFDHLAEEGRATLLAGCWVATERRTSALELNEDDLVAAECLGGHLALAGPIELETLVGANPLPGGLLGGAPMSTVRAKTAIARLEGSGVAIQLPDGRWCARHLLVRLHAASRASLRRHVRPASIADLVRFLVEWQHVSAEGQLEGRAGLLAVISQLQGIELPAGAWEAEVLAARVRNYDPRWLDELCLAGEVGWGRLSPRPARDGARRGASTPSPATPLSLARREDLLWLLDAVRVGEPAGQPETGAAAELLDALRERGALFRSDLAAATGRMAHEIDEGLWDLVAGGLVTADAFSAVRTLLSARRRGQSHRRRPAVRGGLSRRAEVGSGMGEGRWSLLDAGASRSTAEDDEEALAEAVAGQLLERWGIVAWELWARESFRTPWRTVVRALRRLEARGLVLGGRFVAGLSGEQYALAEAAELLGQVRRQPGRCAEIAVAAADPLNVTGTIIPGPRVPGVRRRVVVFRDGLHIATTA